MRFFIFFLFIIVVFTSTSKAQDNKNYSREFLFMNENDIYLFMNKDGYYTNGFLFQYSKLASSKKNKTIQRFSLGQNIYTVGDRRATWRWEAPFDRPYCGYLFLKYTNDKFTTENTLFSTSAEVGVTGDWAFGRQLQEWYHRVLSLFNYPYWQTQIPNQFGINVGFKYATSITNTNNQYSKFKIVPIAEANVGTFFINAKTGAYFCLGKFKKNSNSALFNAVIQKKDNPTNNSNEFFLYLYPQIIYQAYNATVQGNIFRKETNPNVFETSVNPFMFQQTLGVAYTKNRWTTKLELVYQTKEAKTQVKDNGYAGLHFAYRF